jgi:hypothetical protein
MDFVNPTVEKLRRRYWGMKAKEKDLKAARDGLENKIKEMTRASLDQGGDRAARDTARRELQDLEASLAAANDELAKIAGQVTAALSLEIDRQSRDPDPLQEEIDARRRAAARLLGRSLALIRFLQQPQGVFAPDELLQIKVGHLAGKKSEPFYYSEVLAALEAGVAEAAPDLPKDYPEFTQFKKLTKKLRFLRAWAGPPPSTASTLAEWSPSQVAGIANKPEHLKLLVRQALAGPDKV